MATSSKKATPAKSTKPEPIQSPRGTQDILPAEQKYWEYVIETGKSVLRGFGFQRIDTPIFEEKALYVRGVGEETDIVNKEMFELKSRGSGGSYVLRPEGTAAIARAYIEHGMRSWPKPVKLFTVGPYFRYERPQKGRWRQHHQFSVEVLGSASPVVDAFILFVLDSLFKDLGLEDYTLQLNTLGEPKDRTSYVKALKDHYRKGRSKTCKTCKERLKTNPLRVLDCKEEKCQQLANTAPRLLDYLSEESRQHFEQVVSLLDQLEVSYQVTPALVRGLDYYQQTVFEFVGKAQEGEESRSFTSGGRYDGLIKSLGGKPTAGIGVGIGIERVIDQLKDEGVELTVADKPLLFVAHLGEEAKQHTMRLLRRLQQAGIPFAEGLDRDGMQAQLKLADRLNVPWSLIIGHKEVIDKTVILRSMESGMQEVIPQETLEEDLKKRLNLEDA